MTIQFAVGAESRAVPRAFTAFNERHTIESVIAYAEDQARQYEISRPDAPRRMVWLYRADEGRGAYQVFSRVVTTLNRSWKTDLRRTYRAWVADGGKRFATAAVDPSAGEAVLVDPGPNDRAPTRPEYEALGPQVAAQGERMYDEWIASGGKPFHAMPDPDF